MIEFQPIRYDLKPETKRAFYREVLGELSGLMEPMWWTNLASASAVLNAHLPQINWVGFYLAVVGPDLAPASSVDADKQLLLGPFQGMPACLRIPLGKGVCGTAAASRKSVVVADVEQFPGHIPCDSRSRLRDRCAVGEGRAPLGGSRCGFARTQSFRRRRSARP